MRVWVRARHRRRRAGPAPRSLRSSPSAEGPRWGLWLPSWGRRRSVPFSVPCSGLAPPPSLANVLRPCLLLVAGLRLDRGLRLFSGKSSTAAPVCIRSHSHTHAHTLSDNVLICSHTLTLSKVPEPEGCPGRAEAGCHLHLESRKRTVKTRVIRRCRGPLRTGQPAGPHHALPRVLGLLPFPCRGGAS